LPLAGSLFHSEHAPVGWPPPGRPFLAHPPLPQCWRPAAFLRSTLPVKSGHHCANCSERLGGSVKIVRHACRHFRPHRHVQGRARFLRSPRCNTQSSTLTPWIIPRLGAWCRAFGQGGLHLIKGRLIVLQNDRANRLIILLSADY
jgi:hypothetical protein